LDSGSVVPYTGLSNPPYKWPSNICGVGNIIVGISEGVMRRTFETG
jgi:hypothetical protein